MNALQLVSNPETFEHLQRVAKMYAASELIPPHLRGKVADVTIALSMAQEMGENPVVVMQNIYVVSGRAGWSSAYIIARANRSGIFKGRIDWEIVGSGKGLSVTAYAVLANTGARVSYTVSMEMAEAEGWTKNPKYRTMPELMLRYRAGAALVRLYAWDVMLGYSTVEELETIPSVEVVSVTSSRTASSGTTARAALRDDGPPSQVIEGEVERDPVPADPTPADDDGAP